MPARTSSSERLAVWVIGPAALVFAIGLVARWALPEVECGEGGEEGNEVVAAVATVLAMIALLVAAGIAIRDLRESGRLVAHPRVTAVLAVSLVVVGAFVTARGTVIALLGFGDVVTAVLFLVLLVALLAAQTRDQVGLLLPAYLAGMALFVCPTVIGLFALGSSGIGC